MFPPPPSRRVRRLHVRAAAEDDARHAATLLEDALGTASLPDADRGRMLVLRRLPLGRIPARATSASLALHIENVLREVMSGAVVYDLPEAASAAAIVFPDRGDALVRLARVLARGMPTEEWFWPSIVPGWKSATSRRERWLLLLETAHSTPQGATLAASVTFEALEAGVEDELLGSLSPGQGARWLRAVGWGSLEPARFTRRPEPLTGGVIERWQAKWTPADDRLIWLGTMMVLRNNPGAAADSSLPNTIAATLDRRFSPLSPEAPNAGITAAPAARPQSASDPRVRRAEAGAAADSSAESIGIEDEARPSACPENFISAAADSIRPVTDEYSPFQPTEHIARHRPEQADESPPPERPNDNMPAGIVAPPEPANLPTPVDAVPEPRIAARKTPLFGELTPYAGLLFVAPILERLGLAEYLDSHPSLLEAGFPDGLIRTIGERAGLKSFDPLLEVFPAMSGLPAGLPTFHVSQMPEAAFAILSTPEPRAALDSPTDAWLAAVRRWSRRTARLGLIALIRRTGRIYVSRSHIDVCFNLSQLDVRLRRVALDVDPGWVPWLSRVVQFHYLDNDEYTT